MSILLDLPDHLNLDPLELKWRLAAQLFDEGRLTSGQAAELVGISKEEFVLGVGRFGVSVFQYSAEELDEDLRRAA